jgi:delta1-piperideine-2-carboxylate reductase
MDPQKCGGGAGWLAHSEEFFERMTAMEGVRLPGDRRYARRRPDIMIDVPAALVAKLKR